MRLFNWVQTHLLGTNTKIIVYLNNTCFVVFQWVTNTFIYWVSFFNLSLFTDSNLLACSCTGVIALALGSDVYLWNSETQSLEGHVHPGPGSAGPHTLPGRAGRPRQAVSSLCWSGDGRLLGIGTRQGLIQVRINYDPLGSFRIINDHLGSSSHLTIIRISVHVKALSQTLF